MKYINNFADILLEDIMRYRSVTITDDVYWDERHNRYVGSFVWNGVPITARCLRAFSDWVQTQLQADREAIVVIGLRSSGIAWATAVCLRTEAPLIALRLEKHKYGPFNPDLQYYNPKCTVIVDNFCGSGDSIKRALDLAERNSLAIRHIFIVESSGAYEHPLLHSMLSTPDKLMFLLRKGYFEPRWQEIISKYVYSLNTYLDDIDWVREVKRQLSTAQ